MLPRNAKRDRIPLIDKRSLAFGIQDHAVKDDAWFRSDAHLAWIRTLDAVDDGRGKVEAAHVRLGTDGAAGRKPSDFYVLPLTQSGHMQQHNKGEASFYHRQRLGDPVMLALSYAMRSPCERTRKAAQAVRSGKPWQTAFMS